VKIVDLNLLLYAINADSANHARAKNWLEGVLSGNEPVGLPWAVLLGFLRLTTNPRILSRPLTSSQAMEMIDGWLALPCVRILSPRDEHWRVLRSLLDATGTAGNLTTDAHLAALAIENGCELCSTDSDFRRFPKLRWTNPLALPH
jgi:toxin-antitoxin system PIN domain toxin